MPSPLKTIPVGAVIRHPDWPGLWEVTGNRALLADVRRIGADTGAVLWSGDLVEVIELPIVERGKDRPT